jgi:selenide,water dikinase
MTGDHSLDDDPDGTGPRLTEHADLHGCSCKVGQGELEELLADAGLAGDDDLLCGIGEDAAARKLGADLALVQTVDFFTPIVDDPYDFGQVAACNAASDAFATGATETLSCLVVLALPRDLTEYASTILAGMADALDGVGGTIAGGHTTLNPWPVAGGAVTATAHPDDLLTTRGGAPGDRLYLTKPLGTQPAMGALRVRDGEFGATVRDVTDRPIEAIGADALAWMTTPNREAARVAREHASAATDVTGFGLLGQGRVLADNAGVGVELTHLPVIDGTAPLSELFGYGLGAGESAETSGGLLLAVPDDRADDLAGALADAGVFAREVGRVTDGAGARLVDAEMEPVRR